MMGTWDRRRLSWGAGAIFAILLALSGCATGQPISLASTSSPPAFTSTPDPTATPAIPTPTPTVAASPTLMPSPTTVPSPTPMPSPTESPQASTPEVPLWIADYRPDWIGYADASGAFVVVEPNGEGDTKTSQAGVTFASYHYPPAGPSDQILATWTDVTGRVETIVFRGGTQLQFDDMLDQWQQEVFAAAPCAVGIKNYDATLVFTGTQAHAWCAAVGADQTMETRSVVCASQMASISVSGAGTVGFSRQRKRRPPRRWRSLRPRAEPPFIR